jgi:hypothetical protein
MMESFRRHIGWRADIVLKGWFKPTFYFTISEIDDLHPSTLHQNVCWLEISMNDPFPQETAFTFEQFFEKF